MSENVKDGIESRLQEVRKRMRVACLRSGRETKDVELVLVTKTVDAQRIREAYQVGIKKFGENRIQEFLSKQENLPKDIDWHLIGHLQSNKVKFAVGSFQLIHSCDRLELARAIQKQSEKMETHTQVLIQVNTTGEETKYGFHPDAVEKAISEIVHFDRVQVRGLMTIGPFTEDKKKIREAFRLLRTLQDQMRERYSQLAWHYLSMGMSSDYEIAIEEGSNCVRVGTAVFGAR